MAYQFTYTPRFQKRYKSFNANEKKQLAKTLALLAENPMHPLALIARGCIAAEKICYTLCTLMPCTSCSASITISLSVGCGKIASPTCFAIMPACTAMVSTCSMSVAR